MKFFLILWLITLEYPEGINYFYLDTSFENQQTCYEYMLNNTKEIQAQVNEIYPGGFIDDIDCMNEDWVEQHKDNLHQPLWKIVDD